MIFEHTQQVWPIFKRRTRRDGAIRQSVSNEELVRETSLRT
jgi:hypothetical protein